MEPEESTVRLYHRLEDGLGRDTATVLAEHLGTFATKQDIADLRETVVNKIEFTEFKADISAAMSTMESRVYRAVLTTALVLVGTNIALLGAATAFLASRT